MSAKEILLLGDDRLYNVCEPVKEKDLEVARQILKNLDDTMKGFRQKYGFGRAIAAPQIGDAKRIIYLNTGDQIIGFINPTLSFPDKKMIELWDDCMSFPGLEVKVKRYDRVNIVYKDSNWKDCEVSFQGDLAELIQHEYDHLDGILAVQRGINNKSFRMNSDKAGCY